MQIIMKHTTITILGFLIVTFSFGQSSNFTNSKITTFQSKLQREIEKNADVLYPENGIVHRFFVFELDSTGTSISKFMYIDSEGKIDSTIDKKSVSKLIFYWKDILPAGFKNNEYLFIQPVLIKKFEDEAEVNTNFPNVWFPGEKNTKIGYIVRLQQIVISIGKSVK